MPKGNNQKLKLLYLKQLLERETDEEHGVTLQEMVDYLAEREINAERKTIYQDMEELRRYGMDIISEHRGRSVIYRLASRPFELPELKLLVDSVQSARFITERKSRELIRKLEALVSTYDAGKLQRQVIISGRIKTMNESIYYNVDRIHSAIGEDCRIRFRYFQWNVKKEMELRRGGAWYHISPWALLWNSEYYYLIGYDAAEEKIKHFRVDKMRSISREEERRQGRETFEALDLMQYTRALFGMFGGETTEVTLECRNDLAGAVIDRFGKDITLIPVDEAHFRTRVCAVPSGQFRGWIISLGDGIRVTAPEEVVEAFRQDARRLSEQYP